MWKHLYLDHSAILGDLLLKWKPLQYIMNICCDTTFVRSSFGTLKVSQCDSAELLHYIWKINGPCIYMTSCGNIQRNTEELHSCWLVPVKTCTHLKWNIFFMRKLLTSSTPKKVALYFQSAEDALPSATQLCSNTKCLKMWTVRLQADLLQITEISSSLLDRGMTSAARRQDNRVRQTPHWVSYVPACVSLIQLPSSVIYQVHNNHLHANRRNLFYFITPLQRRSPQLKTGDL
jgi:hypothetical protein